MHVLVAVILPSEALAADRTCGKTENPAAIVTSRRAVNTGAHTRARPPPCWVGGSACARGGRGREREKRNLFKIRSSVYVDQRTGMLLDGRLGSDP